jgi:hypothetical protein
MRCPLAPDFARVTPRSNGTAPAVGDVKPYRAERTPLFDTVAEIAGQTVGLTHLPEELVLIEA